MEQQGAAHFFGEPMLDIKDWMRSDTNGKGVINILSAEKLYQMPKLYAASLLWMLSELYEQLPEAGDLEKPKLVFFFDEAHLLFNDAPQCLSDNFYSNPDWSLRLFRDCVQLPAPCRALISLLLQGFLHSC